MLLCTTEPHAKTINALAQEGKIKPVSFRCDGELFEANSVWAATDWLRKNGKYKFDANGKPLHNIVWKLS